MAAELQQGPSWLREARATELCAGLCWAGLSKLLHRKALALWLPAPVFAECCSATNKSRSSPREMNCTSLSCWEMSKYSEIFDPAVDSHVVSEISLLEIPEVGVPKSLTGSSSRVTLLDQISYRHFLRSQKLLKSKVVFYPLIFFI